MIARHFNHILRLRLQLLSGLEELFLDEPELLGKLLVLALQASGIVLLLLDVVLKAVQQLLVALDLPGVGVLLIKDRLAVLCLDGDVLRNDVADQGLLDARLSDLVTEWCRRLPFTPVRGDARDRWLGGISWQREGRQDRLVLIGPVATATSLNIQVRCRPILIIIPERPRSADVFPR